jgi:hypothetical protein
MRVIEVLLVSVTRDSAKATAGCACSPRWSVGSLGYAHSISVGGQSPLQLLFIAEKLIVTRNSLISKQEFFYCS